MNPEKILAQARNNPRDVRFSDFVKLVEAFGFVPRRQSGSHRMFSHPGLPTLVNIQPRPDGKVRHYQVRDFLDDVDRLGLNLEDRA